MAKIEFRAFFPNMQSAIKFGGDSCRITLDIPNSDIPDAVALIALRDMPLKITVEPDTSPYATRMNGDEKPKREKKPPKLKGNYGWFWQSMYKSGLFNNLELAEALNSNGNPETTKSALKLLMEVESLSFLDPARFEAWCSENELHAIVTLCRQALARAKGEA